MKELFKRMQELIDIYDKNKSIEEIKIEMTDTVCPTNFNIEPQTPNEFIQPDLRDWRN